MAKMQKIAKGKKIVDSCYKEEALDKTDVTKRKGKKKTGQTKLVMEKGYKTLSKKKAKDREHY